MFQNFVKIFLIESGMSVRRRFSISCYNLQRIFFFIKIQIYYA